MQERLEKDRPADQRRQGASHGPHRADLVLELAGRSARQQASQGQQRVLALALKVAELETVELLRATRPILLLDDVSSELDPHRAGAVYEYLCQSPGQVFVSTTRPDLFRTPGISEGQRADPPAKWRPAELAESGASRRDGLDAGPQTASH